MIAGPVVVFGSRGQVGSALVKLLSAASNSPDATPVLAYDSSAANFRDPAAVRALLEQLPQRPAAVVNCAAYTMVDRAEQEEDLARAINAETPAAIARYCAAHDIPFVHFSTDYVFSGDGEQRWVESDPVNPQNAYGRTKLEGERKVAEGGGRWIILRTSWVYDAWGKNFLRTMVRLGLERDELKVVSDQHGAPTYAPALAQAVVEILKRFGRSERQNFPSGVYHLCNAGETTWHGFATAILEAARARKLPVRATRITPIPTAEYPTPARRPLNSRLDCSKAERVLEIRLPDWRESLADCMKHVENPTV